MNLILFIIKFVISIVMDRCKFCNHGHKSEEHVCKFCKVVGDHAIIDCPDKTCRFCRNVNHTTEEHKCKICGVVGQHNNANCTAWLCKLCGVSGHKPKDHRVYCDRLKCKIYGDHIHTCIYCVGDHSTEQHQCSRCRDSGHDIRDHFKHAYCQYCQVIGHHEKDTHIHCKSCDFMYVNTNHFFCKSCGECSTREHQEKICEYCTACLVIDDHYESRCSKCYMRPGDLQKFSIESGIHIPTNMVHSLKK